MSTSFQSRFSSTEGTIRSLIWTTLFCVAIAVLLWVTGVAEPFSASLAISLTVGWSISAMQLFVYPRLESSLGPMLANVAGTTIGLALALSLIGLYSHFANLQTNNLSWSTTAPALFFGVVGTILFTSMARLNEVRQELSNAEVKRLATERALTEAQLKTLQAQIEPHFLFNTLATAMGLIRSEPEAAEETLEQLTKLLRNSLSRTRTEDSTLGEEFELINAYLRIAKIRMGDRLKFSVISDDNLAGFSLPPLLVQPLVENALTHGLEPAEQGGEVNVEAIHRENGVQIRVSDSGLGLANNSSSVGTNTGLRNVRERLQQLYGDRGELKLTANSPSGVTAILNIPANAA